jgi:hypothetical protein
MRWNGVTTVKVIAHGFTQGVHAGASLRISGAPDPSYNVTSTINKVVDVDTLQFLQPTQNDIHTELKGGAISVG